MLKPIGCVLGVIVATTLVPRAVADSAQAPANPAAQTRQSGGESRADEGIPVTSDLVKRKCGTCHRADEKGRLSRISYRRTTPEGWEQTIKRMITLNNVPLEPAEARDIVRYLADHHGLAPEEAKPAAFEVERRLIEYSYPGDKDTERTCTACHSMGRVVSQRRTKEEWTLLLEMHRAIYPGTDTVFRRSPGGRRGGASQSGAGSLPAAAQSSAPQSSAAPDDNRHPDRKSTRLNSSHRT